MMNYLAFATVLASWHMASATPILHPGGKPDLCHGAINCETVYNNVTGYHQIRYKDGMGPNSPWYLKHVAPYDDFDDRHNLEVRELSDEDGFYDLQDRSLEKRKNKVNSNLDKSSAQIIWGDHNPGETMHNSLSSHCFQTSCFASYSITTSYFKNGVEAQGKLQFDTDGDYPAGHKDYYVSAIAAIANKLHKTSEHGVTTCTGGGDTGTSCTTKKVKFYSSGKYFSITRFVHVDGSPVAASHLIARVTFSQTDGSQVCSQIVSALGALMSAGGAVAAIGGGFFGAFGQGFCN